MRNAARPARTHALHVTRNVTPSGDLFAQVKCQCGWKEESVHLSDLPNTDTQYYRVSAAATDADIIAAVQADQHVTDPARAWQ